MEYLESDFFLIALTFGVYFLAKRLQARTGWVVLNPILLAILALIGFLKVTGISYETYAGSASIIDFWLKPAIVALGVPLYLQLKSIRRQLMPVLVSQLVGCFVGIVSREGEKPYRPKPEHGHGFARRRDIACHGIRAYLWGVC